jgi:hypothetical protein
MTQEQKRIAIAEACGWRLFSQIKNLWAPPRCVVEYDCDACPLPDYFSDLNAMHEAEKVLNDVQKERFVFWLNHLHPSADIHYSEIEKDIRLEVFSLVSATATQRAEAFGRTLNLWK